MPLIRYDVAHQQEDFGLSADEVALLWQMEERHFWHQARNRWIARALADAGVAPPASILEVGCGSGAVAQALHARGYQVTGIDTAALLVEKAHQRCPAATFIVGDVARLEAGPFAAIGLFDVLEHLGDPLAMLRNCRRRGRPGTVFAVTVPAQSALHTVIDDLSGHKRRYEVGELAALLGAAGLTDIVERGLFRLMVPMQKASRRGALAPHPAALGPAERHALWKANFRIPPWPLNPLLGALCAVERVLGFGNARNRTGASLLATARVPS
jgi:2-polyprenyl-3-methyl-5-hydroxy-6-metoxy-1,4-benzoquinol methylase